MLIVVRVIDNYTGADPATIAKSRGRGDVVQALPDDHVWGRLDLGNPDWVVFRVDIPEAEAQAMTAAEGAGFELPGARIRAFDLDLDFLASKYSGIPSLQDATDIRDKYLTEAAQSGVSVHATKYAAPHWADVVEINPEDFRAAKRQKPAVPDPSIIG